MQKTYEGERDIVKTWMHGKEVHRKAGGWMNG